MSQDAAVRVEIERCAKLRTLCERRWASRDDSLFAFRTAFSAVVQAVESLTEDGDAKARGYVSSILQFDFIIALFPTGHVLSNTSATSVRANQEGLQLSDG